MADQPTSSGPTNSFEATDGDGADQMSHFSNADYDWMGVLDGCFGHSPNGHEHHALPAVDHGGNSHDSKAGAGGQDDDDSAAKLTSKLMAAAEDHSIVTPAEALAIVEQSQPLKNHESPPPSEEDCKKPASCKGAEGEVCTKKCDRIERKRNREKQRRLDINSQFTTLASIVREIETTDFMEEAQFHSLYELAQEKPKAEGEAAEADSNKRLKSDDSLFPGGSIQNAISAAGTYSASNRVELIARTSLMLSQFRAIRKKRNGELRDARRQNCELKKEVEELRRMVAHYKTMGMGMGQQKTQEKIMMMVPMMVPQDAVNSVASGFPAAHLMGGAFAPQWMSPPAVAHAMQTNNSNASFPQQAQAAHAAHSNLPHAIQNQNALNPAYQFNAHQMMGQALGAAAFPQAQAFSFQVPGMQQTETNNSGQNSNPPSTGHSTPQQFAQATTPMQSLMPPSIQQGMLQAQSTFQQNPAMAMMFPHTATTAPSGLPMQNSTESQQTANLGPQQPSSEKPPSAPQGGGGNLAHCA